MLTRKAVQPRLKHHDKSSPYQGLSRTTVKRENAIMSVSEWQGLCENQDTRHQGDVINCMNTIF